MTRERFSALYDLTARDLLGYLLRRTRDPEDAADCLAETFLIAWNKRDQIPSEDSQARPWLFGVARNVLRRDRELYLKSSQATAELARDLHDTYKPVEIDAPITRALQTLSALDREIIEMLAWDHLSPREVALILKLSSNVVRIRSHRARSKLREHVAMSSTALVQHAPERR